MSSVKGSWRQKLGYIIPILLVVFIFFCFPTACGHSHDHEHSHDHHGHSHEHHGHSHDHANDEKPAFKWSQEANQAQQAEDTNSHGTIPISNDKWVEAMGATLLISIAPYLILFFIPITNTKEHAPYLKVLLAFASGGLLGDAFLHLIPHAMMASMDKSGGGHSHSHSHGGGEGGHAHDTSVGVSVLGGMLTFLVVEKFMRIFTGGHSHSHSSDTKAVEKSKKNQKQLKDSKKVDKSREGSSMKVAGYLNLAADFTHNVTDGLAIGASFMAGRSIGLVTTFTIFLHEIPHEIGDFAILIQSGCTRRKAMMLQLVTALGALTGTALALMAEGADGSYQAWILPFTAGGFIYIATVSVIPELLENSSFWQSVCEVAAILLGVALMVLITWVEEYEAV